MLQHPVDDTYPHGGTSARLVTPIPVEQLATLGRGEPRRAGRFRFYIAAQRWEWSDSLKQLLGYLPGTVTPTSDLLVSHTHPEDREDVTAVLGSLLEGEPVSSHHRIIDTAGRTHWVLLVGDSMLDDGDNVVGTSGFCVDLTDTMQHNISTAVSKVAEARAEIEQAKGLLMAAYDISADQAFGLLVWRSQETNIKVRELARRFVIAMAGALPANTRTQVDRALLTIS